MNKQSLFKTIIIVGILVGIPVGWYLLSPLWTNVEVSEEFPTAAVAVSLPTDLPTDPPATPMVLATDAMATAMVVPTEELIEKMPEPEMVVLAQGSFYPVAHASQGTATVYQLADGSRILRLQDFSVDNGPALHVYLTSTNPVTDTLGVELANNIDLGELKGNIGDQNYIIPADVDLANVGSVVIWCQPFRVSFSAAPLVEK